MGEENPPRIVLVATWSYFNKGDMLVLASTLDLVREVYPKSRISIIAPDCESYAWASLNDRSFQGIEVYPTPTRTWPFGRMALGCPKQVGRFTRRLLDSLPSPFWLLASISFLAFLPILYLVLEFRKTLRALSQASLILWCSGTLFYAPKGQGLHSIFEEMLTLLFCKMILRKTTIFAPVSIGPIQSAVTRSILKNLLNKADHILFRENISYEYAKGIGVTNRNTGVSADSAFLYGHEIPKARLNPNGGPPIVGVAPTSFRAEASRQHLEAVSDFLSNLKGAASRIILLPFSPFESDDTTAEYILNALGHMENVVKYDLTYADSEELLRRVSEVDILMAMRLHYLIAASLMEIPSIAIVGQKNKFWGILRRLGMEDYALDLDSLTEGNLELKFSRLLRDMDTVKATLRERSPKMREEAASLNRLLKHYLSHSMQPGDTQAPLN